MSRTVTARAPGKINLQLAVGPRGDDGYHPLVSVFQAIDLYETVAATTRADGEIRIRVDARRGAALDVTGVPTGPENLAWRAARAVQEAFGVDDGADLAITKGVPVAGGMAGGSADAAAALVACAELWDVGASRDELHDLAAALGADVPFVLHGHTAVGTGRGDVLSPAMVRGEFHWVLATQREGLSTPAVYGRFDADLAAGERTADAPDLSPPVMSALMAGDAHALGAALSNDLQDAAVALQPRLEGVMQAARDADALGVMVSGSGPTVAALARSRQHALGIAAHLTAVDVADAVLSATGPAPGATIIEHRV